ncbi:MAG: DUF5685 family protein [Clostridiales bacterium]|nr:DUF5685 family protein [Clostridiales bacterium]
MFGYITPFMPELRVRDKELYQAYYCGLCRALGKYGLTSRLTLTYDATFAAVLLSAVTGKEPHFSLRGCAAHPVRGRIPTVDPDEVSDFCAGVCVLLAKYKLLDDAGDGRPIRKAAIPVIKRGIKRAEKKYPEAAAVLSEGLARLSAIESASDPDPDKAPMLFGELLGKLLSSYPGLDESSKPLLTELGCKLGCYVYAADAWDDREEDKKRKSYNMFLLSGLGEDKDACAAMLDMYINSAVLAYDLLDLKLNKPLLDNIMYMGLGCRASEALQGKNEKKDPEDTPEPCDDEPRGEEEKDK